MVYHWQSHNVKQSGVEDMVLLPQATEQTIVENLRKRYMDDFIFTCIGPVLISVNPFKQISCFTQKEIDQYQGAAPYENPPHIYGLTDEMYRNLLIDNESQCVIISGESGAGKTVAARHIMSYIAYVSGGTSKVQHVKDVVLESNPLLESFGNAKTVRNDNSSRFGKYVEIVFGSAGDPKGGRISNFLLEKSRVTNVVYGERNFHIFYQLCCGSDATLKQNLGLMEPEAFEFLNSGGDYKVKGLNDSKSFEETLSAMRVMGLSPDDQQNIWYIVAAVLHLGNITFKENGNYACVEDNASLAWPAYLLSIDQSELESKFISRRLDGSKWGAQSELIDITHSLEQAVYARNALAKAVYAKLFDYLVQRVNAAMFTDMKGNNIGILDIYGFEILEKNGFEQFCINFVNEKLQQTFIQLTLKAEQEEYRAENISWTHIDFFDNKKVCELMEERRPPGLFLVMDDVCATVHAVSGADEVLQKKLDAAAQTHAHYAPRPDGFVVRHYAGSVHYHVDGFCDRNRDVLYPDLVELVQSSSNDFIRALFPEPTSVKTRPSTAGTKIRSQANELIARLELCAQHYVRCIKPNENKQAHDWDSQRVRHQVEYLGLRENISVRRAGFAYRRPFSKFLQRYSILTPQTWPRWRGDERGGVTHILSNAGLMIGGDYQMGRTKVFIKAPESLFSLEELRDQQYNKYARIIQKAFKQHFARKQQDKERQDAAALVFGKKERRRFSVNRHFVGDYIGIDGRLDLQKLINRRDRVVFAVTVCKFDRRFKASSRELVLTSRSLLLVGKEPSPGTGRNGPLESVIKRNIPFPNISHVALSTLQDDFVVIYVKDNYDTLLEVPFKTEFLSALSKKYAVQTMRNLDISFSNCLDYEVKRSGFGGGGTRRVVFVPTLNGDALSSLRVTGTTLTISIGSGLAPDTQPLAKHHPRRKNGLTLNQNSQLVRPPAPTRAAPPPPVHSPVSINFAPPLPKRPTTTAPDSTKAAPPIFSPSKSPTAKTFPARAPPPGKSPVTDSGSTTAAFRRPSTSPTVNTPPAKSPAEALSEILARSPMSKNAPARSPTIATTPPAAFPNKSPRPEASQNGNKYFPNQSALHPTTNGASNGSTEKAKIISAAPDFNEELTKTLRRIRSKNAVEQLNMANGNKESESKNIPQGKPIPGGGRPRPQLKQITNRVKALYDYSAQDNDEITLKEGDVIDLLKEHPGGWWQGRLNGKEGLFPSNYVQKI